MRERPICIVFLVAIAVMSMIHFLNPPGEETPYDGEEKELICVVDSISGQGNDRSFVMRDVLEGKTAFCDKIKVYTGGISENFPDVMTDARVGNIYRLKGTLYSFEHAGNPGQFDEYQYYHSRGISYRFFMQSGEKLSDSYHWLSHQLCRVQNSFFIQFNRCLPEEEGGLLAAMLLGEKCELSKETKALYQCAGISHILAISGLHISIIGMGLFFLLRRFVLPVRQAALVCGCLLVLYGELTGFPVATQRAIIMTLCVLGARFLGRRYDVYCALSLSALIQMIAHPTELFQAGFLLSYGTVFGIAFFVGEFQGSNKKYLLWHTIKGSVGIQLVTLPVVVYFYYEINPYSVFVNLLVLPLAGILIPMAILGGITAMVYLTAGKFLFGIVHFILQCYEQLCLLAQHLPGARLILGRPAMWQILLYYGLLILWCGIKKYRSQSPPKPVSHIPREIRSVPWLLCVAVLILFFRLPKGNILTITNLDMGQGDCACIRLGGSTILLDGGSSDKGNVGEYRIVPFLKSQGISRIDKICITHPDSDHTSGLLEILQDKRHMGLQIGAVVLPGLEKEDEAYRELIQICVDAGVEVEFCNRGDALQIRGMTLRCLHPAKEYEWSSVNDYSLVLSLEYGIFRGIFTGDLEQTGEDTCMDGITKSQYLKVGHHGSAGSSSEAFLSRVKPEISVISAGKNNRYGHPSKEVLDRLGKIGSKSIVTADSGAVTVRTDGKSFHVEKYLKNLG